MSKKLNYIINRILIGALFIGAGILVKILYTGSEVDAAQVSEALGTSRRGNLLAIIAILFMRFFASWAGFILLWLTGGILIGLGLSGIKKNSNE